MKEQAGKIIDFVRENRTVPGCTISKQIYHENGTGISIFSRRKEQISVQRVMNITNSGRYMKVR